MNPDGRIIFFLTLVLTPLGEKNPLQPRRRGRAGKKIIIMMTNGSFNSNLIKSWYSLLGFVHVLFYLKKFLFLNVCVYLFSSYHWPKYYVEGTICKKLLFFDIDELTIWFIFNSRCLKIIIKNLNIQNYFYWKSDSQGYTIVGYYRHNNQNINKDKG